MVYSFNHFLLSISLLLKESPGCCYFVLLKNNHPCVERAMQHDCPIFFEGLMIVDRQGLYGSKNLSNQHREMRLDINDMSYKKLLALGESIGNVNMGLSEDLILKCLMKSIYCLSNQYQDEGTCDLPDGWESRTCQYAGATKDDRTRKEALKALVAISCLGEPSMETNVPHIPCSWKNKPSQL